MITAINSASAQNCTALKNRPRAQGQNFGKIIFDTKVFNELKTEAGEEIAKGIKETSISDTISRIAGINMPITDFLKKAIIFKEIVTDGFKNVKGVNADGARIEEGVKSKYMELNDISNTDVETELAKFHDLFYGENAPLDITVSAEKINNDNNGLVPNFLIENKELGVDFGGPRTFDISSLVVRSQKELDLALAKKQKTNNLELLKNHIEKMEF